MSNSKKSNKSLLKRKKFIQLGLASAAAVISTPYAGFGKEDRTHEPDASFRTKLCEVLNIDYPVLQSGMGSVAGPDLAAKVSEAGGLGIVGASGMPLDELRAAIRKVKGLTRKPFGVNLLLHEGFMHPVDVSMIPDDDVKKVQETLNQFRRQLDLPESWERPKPLSDSIPAAFQIILEEKVPVFSIGLGNPPIEWVQQCHKNGTKVITMIATVEDAKQVAANGVDIIIAQGSEAGGHRSTWKKRASVQYAAIGTFALVPQVANAVQQPVVAAGGITDGKGLIAALALGATGVLIGTRFIASKEAVAPLSYKSALLNTSNDNTIITDVFSGGYARVIRNTFTDQYEKSKAPVYPPFIQSLEARNIYRTAREKNNAELFPLWAGQGIGNIHDIPGADEIVRSIMNEARQVLGKLPKKI